MDMIYIPLLFASIGAASGITSVVTLADPENVDVPFGIIDVFRNPKSETIVYTSNRIHVFDNVTVLPVYYQYN